MIKCLWKAWCVKGLDLPGGDPCGNYYFVFVIKKMSDVNHAVEWTLLHLATWSNLHLSIHPIVTPNSPQKFLRFFEKQGIRRTRIHVDKHWKATECRGNVFIPPFGGEWATCQSPPFDSIQASISIAATTIYIQSMRIFFHLADSQCDRCMDFVMLRLSQPKQRAYGTSCRDFFTGHILISPLHPEPFREYPLIDRVEEKVFVPRSSQSTLMFYFLSLQQNNNHTEGVHKLTNHPMI